jgi:hypothetical protein
VHDIADLERRGIPGVFVASAEFVVAAESQARSLGFPAARVFVPHPIQDRTDAEMEAYADAAFDEVVSRLTTPGSPGPDQG